MNTGPTEFGFAQLFSPNQFVGDDRIADVNQLTAALVSRIILPDSGAERLRLAVAQRLNFGSQRVSIPGFHGAPTVVRISCWQQPVSWARAIASTLVCNYR